MDMRDVNEFMIIKKSEYYQMKKLIEILEERIFKKEVEEAIRVLELYELIRK